MPKNIAINEEHLVCIEIYKTTGGCTHYEWGGRLTFMGTRGVQTYGGPERHLITLTHSAEMVWVEEGTG